jgi:hypothetical protein
MATYNGITYDPNVDYMKLINEANAAGNYAQAAQYEKQRNAKIAATNSSYQTTNQYSNYANGSSTLGSQTAGNQGTNYLYNKNTDYQKLINDSVSAGNYSAAAPYEQQRNAKIAGEGIDAPMTYNWQSYLGGQKQPEYSEPGTEAYVNQMADIIKTMLANQNYQPVDQSQYMQNAMGYDEAYKLAQSIVAPQYADTYEQTARAAQQRLGAAGLSDSLYGQALAAQSENQVNKDMNAAIGNLALQIQDMSYDQAYKLLQSAMQENQYGNSSRVNALGTAANATANIIGALQDAANERNDFALQAASLQLDQQAQALERQYFQGQLTAQQLENEMAKLELDAARTAMDNNVATTAVYSSGGGRSRGGSSGGSYSGGEPLVGSGGDQSDSWMNTLARGYATVSSKVDDAAAVNNAISTFANKVQNSSSLTTAQKEKIYETLSSAVR